ncbi:MAG: hypothetical protein A2Y25_08850 [Candidatus Melainabacteria bacterium GWF2_37_15]|nr:MAG: hypothetical protein A2Y25_08850 [Candidatus Melainabacteria bacterium GWF2_37_15]
MINFGAHCHVEGSIDYLSTLSDKTLKSIKRAKQKTERDKSRPDDIVTINVKPGTIKLDILTPIYTPKSYEARLVTNGNSPEEKIFEGGQEYIDFENWFNNKRKIALDEAIKDEKRIPEAIEVHKPYMQEMLGVINDKKSEVIAKKGKIKQVLNILS